MPGRPPGNRADARRARPGQENSGDEAAGQAGICTVRGGLAIGVSGALLGLALCVAPVALAAEESRGDHVADHVAALKRRTALPPGYAPVTLAWVAQLPTPESATRPTWRHSPMSRITPWP